MKKVMRYDVADFLNTAESTETETWTLMGSGFNTLDESPSPKVEKTTYVNDKSSSADISGYEPSFSFDSDVIADEAAVMNLHKIGHDQLTGPDAERDYVRVDLYDPVLEKENTFKARKFRVAVEVSDFSGEGAKVMKVKGNMHQIGDLIKGEFNTATKKFTAEGAAAAAVVGA